MELARPERDVVDVKAVDPESWLIRGAPLEEFTLLIVLRALPGGGGVEEDPAPLRAEDVDAKSGAVFVLNKGA